MTRRKGAPMKAVRDGASSCAFARFAGDGHGVALAAYAYLTD
jgi:hypothetical protein